MIIAKKGDKLTIKLLGNVCEVCGGPLEFEGPIAVPGVLKPVTRCQKCGGKLEYGDRDSVWKESKSKVHNDRFDKITLVGKALKK